MVPLRTGLVGAGLVGQAEHAFYLWEEKDRFAFVALADASPTVREAVGNRYGLEKVAPDLAGILAGQSRRGRDRRARPVPRRSRRRGARRRDCM